MYFLGIDCGSVAVKAVLIDDEKNVVGKSYYRNRGIIPTLQNCLYECLRYDVNGVGITGSGRSLAAAAVGADVVETEILAHAVAAIEEKPDVQTILDIGGEDSKLIKVRNGIACDFRMNQICGAGTGALVDSIAVRLGVKTEDVGKLALEHNEELDLPGKCGVFTQSAVVSRLNAGAAAADILWGVCKALVRNFLLLGRGVELKPPFVFQGAVARNKAVVVAMKEELGYPIIVPEYCAYTGAIGVAMLAREKRIDETAFKGVEALNGVTTRIIRGDGCPNRCDITQLILDGKVVGFSGSRCGKCGG